MEALITIWIAAIGLSIGSFLNVVIARLPNDESIVRPRSKCPKCGHQLAWYENIPVVSWLALRGKCSNCKAPISPRYILVELLTGALFVACIPRFGFDWELVSALVFLTFLIPLIFIDAEHWILPFELTLPGIAFIVLLAIPRGMEAVQTAVVGAVAAFLTFRVMEFLGWLMTGREALGAGDKYLLAIIGAMLGWRSLLGVILFSSLQGAVVGIVMLKLTGRAGPKRPASETPPPVETTAPTETTAPAEATAPVEATAPDGNPLTPTLSPDGERESSSTAAAAEEEEEEAPAREPFTPEFLKPGLPLWKRVLGVPYAIFLQDIPDSPPPDETTGEEPEWVPGQTNLPFGPWIGLAGIEVMLLGPWLVDRLAHTPYRLLSEIVFGR